MIQSFFNKLKDNTLIKFLRLLWLFFKIPDLVERKLKKSDFKIAISFLITSMVFSSALTSAVYFLSDKDTAPFNYIEIVNIIFAILMVCYWIILLAFYMAIFMAITHYLAKNQNKALPTL